MNELKITTHSNYTDIHQLLYKVLKNKMIICLSYITLISFFWWSNSFDWHYIWFAILGLLSIPATTLSDIIEYGPKRLICQLSHDEIITLQGHHVPVENIKKVEFLAKSGNRNSVYDIALVLHTSTKVDLFIEVSAKDMYTLHQIIKVYLDIPFVYVKNGGLFKDKQFSEIREIF